MTVSDEVQLRSETEYELLGNMKGRILLFQNQSTEFEIQAFDSQLRKSWSKKLELEKRLPEVVGITHSSEDFTLFYRHRRKSHNLLKAYKYDPAANLSDSVTIKDYGFLFYTPDFEFLVSENRRKALIYYIEKQNTINALCFDIDSMRILWENTFVPDDFNLTRDFLHLVLSDEGELYMVIEKNNQRSKRENHFFEVHRYQGREKEYNRFNLPLSGNLTYDVKFMYDNLNERLVGGGLYAESNPARAVGYFYLKVDPQQHRDATFTFQEFDDEFVSNLKGKEVDNNKGIAESMVQDIVLRVDGGIVILCERTREFERHVSSRNQITLYRYNNYIVDYFYDDLFIISVNPDGSSHWKNILYKRQYSQDDMGAFSSYFLMKTPSKLRIIFNDEIRHETTVSQYELKGNGNYQRRSVLSTAELELRLRFRDALQIAGDQLIVPSERRNNLRLVKLDY